MFTVVHTPSSMFTLINICLCTTASHIVQPYLSAGRSVVPVINLVSNVPVPITNTDAFNNQYNVNVHMTYVALTLRFKLRMFFHIDSTYRPDILCYRPK